MKLAFIGIGNVGFAIAHHLQQKGYEIIVANNNVHSESVQKALKNNPNFKTMPVQAAVYEADMVFLATPYQANETVLTDIRFHGKTLVDCTNPVGFGKKGLKHGLDSKISGSEVVQSLAPDAKVVKAFTIYGFENFSNAEFPNYNVRPTMMVASDFVEAKQALVPILNVMGYEMTDTGALKQALHLEHLTLLWVEMVRMNKHHPHFVWAYLEK